MWCLKPGEKPEEFVRLLQVLVAYCRLCLLYFVCFNFLRLSQTN